MSEPESSPSEPGSSPSEPGSSPSEPSAELDAIAAELYALRPEDFAAARDERVRTVRNSGGRPLARELARLRRPTQSAWLINALWRHERATLEQFLQLADELAQAQANASGAELLRLTARRRELEAVLLRAARTLAEQSGVGLTASIEREVQETLSAALAEPEVADQIRSGRLVKPATYAGFGTILPGLAQPAARAEPASPAPHAAQPPQDIRAARLARERREAAERSLHTARAAVDAASAALAEHSRAAEIARAHERAIRDQLHDLEQQLATAERAAAAAAKRRDQADTAHAAALQALDEALQQI